MVTFRSLLLLCLVSLSAAAVLYSFNFFSDSPNTFSRRETKNISGFAVLTTDSGVNDREINALLSQAQDDLTGAVISESSQFVFLDIFDSIDMIPLDKYEERLFPFDPRNDGYAEKLKKIFVNNGKRFFYIPVKTPAGGSLDRQLDRLLAGIPYNIEYFYTENPQDLFFVSFAAACIFLIIICYVRREASLVFLLPALSSLAFYGIYGIVLSALFTGLAAMIKEPLKELVIIFNTPPEGFLEIFRKFRKNVFDPYGLNWLLLPLFLLAVTTVAVLAGLNIFFILMVFISICAVLFFSVRIRRFTPLLILRRKTIDFSFSVYMTPFALASFAAILLTPHISGSFVSGSKFDYTIDEKDYIDHIVYQASFSVRQTGDASLFYPEYFIDTDGLPSQVLSGPESPSNLVNFTDYPPFQLGSLMEFFNSVNYPQQYKNNITNTGKNQYISFLILLLFLMPVLFMKNKRDTSFKIQLKKNHIGKKDRYFIFQKSDNVWRKQAVNTLKEA